MKSPLLLGIGELLWDVFPGTRRLGGAPTNVVYHAQGLGVDARLISSLGEDAEGRDAFSACQQLGMDTDLLQITTEYPTGTVQVVADAQGQPTYTIHTGVAYDFIEVTAQASALAAQASAVCFGTLAQRSGVSRDTIRALVAAAPSDCLRLFDVNLRQRFYDTEVIHHSLSLVNMLKINEDELPIVARLLSIPLEENPELTIARLAEIYSLQLIAFTQGAQGSILWTPERVSRHKGYPVEHIADTVGAGDSFTASVLVGLLRGLDLDVIHEGAARLAAYVCTQNGGTPPIPEKLRSLLV